MAETICHGIPSAINWLQPTSTEFNTFFKLLNNFIFTKKLVATIFYSYACH